MSEKTPPPRPRMHKGDCIDELTGKILPKDDCLTKRGKPLGKPHKTKEMIVNGVKKQCIWVESITFDRKEKKDVVRHAYPRKKLTRKEHTRNICRCPKDNPSCKESEKNCRDIVIPETPYKKKIVQEAKFDLPPKPNIQKRGFWSCSEIGE